MTQSVPLKVRETRARDGSRPGLAWVATGHGRRRAAADRARTQGAASGEAVPAAALAKGEVRKVDRNAKKLTLKHGPIAKLEMPPMTTVFQVKDPAVLDQLKPGDKIKFSAERIGGAYTVTRIEPVK